MCLAKPPINLRSIELIAFKHLFLYLSTSTPNFFNSVPVTIGSYLSKLWNSSDVYHGINFLEFNLNTNLTNI